MPGGGLRALPGALAVPARAQGAFSAAHLAIHRSDFHKADLGPAALVTCYLYPGGMERLRPKLEAELRPGAILLSNCFAMPGWTPAATRTADDLYASPVYTYVIPPPPGA